MYQNQVTIGPEFFAKAFNDYSNWRWAICREFMQNSMDCGSGRINVTIELKDGDTVLTVENNGQPMSRDILVTKLLALGGSGKNFQNAVGGFGKAKEVLYYAHKSYQIHTGSHVVNGSGAGYNIEESRYFDGTRSVVVIAGDQIAKLEDSFKTFASYAQWDGKLYLNGQLLETNLKKGSPRRDLGFGMVYTNRSFGRRLIVRINGVPMYHEYIGFDRCVIVELNGSSAEHLTSNRDGLNCSCRYELSSFITELSVDKRSALKNRNLTRYRRYKGEKLRHRLNSLNVRQLVARGDEFVAASVDIMEEEIPTAKNIHNVTTENVTYAKTGITEEFIIKNETDLQVPVYYLPDSPDFSDYSRRLVKIWGRLLVELHRLFETEDEFAIGFVFDEQAEAEYENGDYGRVYYLNPAKIVEQASSCSKSFKKRFAISERNRLLMLALHEFVHGSGHHYHDENYSNALTDMAWKVMDDRKRFNWCFAD